MARHGENIRKRKDGRWEARVLCDDQMNGKSRYKYIYGHSYNEVKKKKNELLTEQAVSRNISEAASWMVCQTNRGAAGFQKETVKTLLGDWVASVQYHVKESTMAKYQFYINKHIVPEMGEILLSNLTSNDIEQFKKHKLTEGRIDQKGGLSPKTVTDMLSVLKLALRYGEERSYFSEGQIKICNPRQTRPQISILSADEQQRLVESILYQEDCSHLGVVIALYAGLRIGEICALRWGDIDFVHAILRVQRTIMRISNYNSEDDMKTKIIIEQPKTECSNRLVPIPKGLLEYLEQYRKDDEYYVITGKKKFMEPRNYYRKYKRMMKKYNLENFTFHALRHTFATRCIESGFDIKSLSEILGHADVSITMQRYAHPSMTLKRYYMEKLEMVAFHGQEDGQIKEKTAN